MTINDLIYGHITIEEPVLLELINSQAMDRLKGIDQEFTRQIKKAWGDNYTRFDHSIGVMHVCKLLGAKLEEQIAALLHDISHTAFSHTMDFVFDNEERADFHEKNIARVVYKSQIPFILEKFGYKVTHIIEPKNFSILEQEIPSLCADRIDYSLRTFYNRELCSLQKTKQLLNNLTVVNDSICFKDQFTAYEYATLFFKAELLIWDGNADDNTRQILFAEIVKNVFKKRVIQLDDFFLTDEAFFNKLDPESKKKIKNITKIKTAVVSSSDDYDYFTRGKIRYVDPPVKVFETETKPLSEINAKFKQELEGFLKKRKRGNYVKILNKEVLDFKL